MSGGLTLPLNSGNVPASIGEEQTRQPPYLITTSSNSSKPVSIESRVLSKFAPNCHLIAPLCSYGRGDSKSSNIVIKQGHMRPISTTCHTPYAPYAPHTPESMRLFSTIYAYRDCSRLRHFLMALHFDYEYTRASILHCHPLPTLGQALAKLKFEETHKKTIIYHQYSQLVPATPSWTPLPRPSQPVRTTPQRLYHLTFKRNIATFVDVTITLIKIVAPATNPDAKDPGKIIGIGHKVGNLFELESLHVPPQSVAAASSSSSHVSLSLWYSRLGSLPSPSLTSCAIDILNVSLPAAPPSISCPPTQLFHQSKNYTLLSS
ncbi:hypothetical protein Acr_00g0012750 [Actinidia rufa]|uniref:Uncharacterized protein n=1 Tax=Actinidia rufa TaxID=165716 RepID=A0A7J0DBJ1_9ERIC|nr:hypothetical protein Acr_00g0012750 [Actinidia rufa]